MQTIVSFPGLGIEEMELNKVAFSLFGKLEVRWYGIFITCGIILAFLYAMWRGKRERVVADDVIDIGILTVVLGVIGARLYYVLTTFNDGYHHYEGFIDVIAVWQGGLAIYGGIIGGAIGVIIVTLWKKINTFKVMDMILPGVMIAQAIGRWGNFFNGEAYGYAIADTTKYYFFNSEYTLPSGEGTLFHTLRMGLGGAAFYHPTFLYECVWNVIGFILLNIFYKHKKFHGQIALLYCTWYGFGRMLIEGLRTDSLYIYGTTLRISQCLGLVCFVVGGILLTVLWIRNRHNNPYGETPVPVTGATPEKPWVHTEETRWGRSIEKILKRHKENKEKEEDSDNGNEN
ncbi:MAG: prolipoprotein diacylglyceryl transferase [Clostridia bacterium]|nr:prolipoprotein diacylglyceryl transferase [Clostridia bacterium]